MIMAKKARRRPSWKKYIGPRPFYIDLINEETGELFERVMVKDGTFLRDMLKRVGPDILEEKLRQGFMDLAKRTISERTKYE
jgi:hypothetical protein